VVLSGASLLPQIGKQPQKTNSGIPDKAFTPTL